MDEPKDQLKPDLMNDQPASSGDDCFDASERRTVGGEQASESGWEAEGYKEGGELCITPPAKSHDNNHSHNQTNNYSILGSGIDTLALSLYVKWKDDSLIDYLEDLKLNAQVQNQPLEGQLDEEWCEDVWRFKIQTFGTKGYAYILVANDYSMKLSRNANPNSMPNLLLEIRSETLWSLGTKEAIERILRHIKRRASSIEKIKPSRVDICVDIEMPEDEWSASLLDKRISRAKKTHIFMDHDKVTGLQIGSGDLFVRIYDKGKEIKEISKKKWMYGVWGIDEPREGTKVIRVEFQIRRAILKTLGIYKLEDLNKEINPTWAYLTQYWLKFLETKEKNRDRQEVLPWWHTVQNGFSENCEPSRRVRNIAIKLEQEQLAKRALAYLEDLKASEIEATRLPKDAEWTLEDCWKLLIWHLHKMGIDDIEISRNIIKKTVNYQRQDNEVLPF